jgi:hypothetical protein
VLPGALYTSEDEKLFERIASAVASDLVSERVARRIVTELGSIPSQADAVQMLLLRIIDELPGLDFLIPELHFRPTTAAHRAQMAKAMGMLLTLVSARARQLESA